MGDHHGFGSDYNDSMRRASKPLDPALRKLAIKFWQIVAIKNPTPAQIDRFEQICMEAGRIGRLTGNIYPLKHRSKNARKLKPRR
jgi:hypothetical protein